MSHVSRPVLAYPVVLEEPPALATAEQSLREVGYHDGTPPHLSTRTRIIDALVCNAMDCPNCGKHGMKYLPLCRKRGNQSSYEYRCVAICGDCGASEEL